MDDSSVQTETEYVLGMMDLYSDDKEIEQMLRMKGFSTEQVRKILESVKLTGYKKRLKQSKKIVILGFLLTVILGLAYLFMSNAGIYNKEDDLLSRINSRMMIKPIFYGSLIAGGQLVFGLYRFITYSHKIKRTKKYQ